MQPETTLELARPALDLSLFQIDEGLAALIEFRQERISDKEAPPDTEELAAIDGEIARYFEALPKKVSGIAAIDRKWEEIETYWEGPKDKKTGVRRGGELDRGREMVKNVRAMRARLRECCAAVLEKQPEPAKGSRKLVGVDGSQIILKRNGGVQPLDISDPDILPDDCCRMVGWIDAKLWGYICDEFRLCPPADPRFSLTRMPDTEAIRAKLAEPCPACGGHPELIVPMLPGEEPGCAVCGGSAKNAVPGARLRERGVHVEIR